MTITYLIGNGFDIGLGLKTGYPDFINWYLSRPPQSPETAWLRSEILAKQEQWSDAEMAFGALKFSEHGSKVLDIYNTSFDSFTMAFHDYLVGENKRFNIPRSERRKVAETFLKHALRLHEFMALGSANYFVGQVGNPLTVNFITFNYTDTLEQILDFRRGDTNEYSIEYATGRTCKVVVRAVCHVHGTLSDAYVFGVDAPEQIAEQVVRRHCERNGGMLKARSDEKLGILNRKQGMDIIQSSDCFVTFGMSFGESDMSWWRMLATQVFNNNRRLIVCPFRKDLPDALSLKKRNDVYVEEKKRVFHSLLPKDPQLDVKLEQVEPPRIVALQVKRVHDAQGIMRHCDYLRLTDIGWKYVKK